MVQKPGRFSPQAEALSTRDESGDSSGPVVSQRAATRGPSTRDRIHMPQMAFSNIRQARGRGTGSPKSPGARASRSNIAVQGESDAAAARAQGGRRQMSKANPKPHGQRQQAGESALSAREPRGATTAASSVKPHRARGAAKAGQKGTPDEQMGVIMSKLGAALSRTEPPKSPSAVGAVGRTVLAPSAVSSPSSQRPTASSLAKQAGTASSKRGNKNSPARSEAVDESRSRIVAQATLVRPDSDVQSGQELGQSPMLLTDADAKSMPPLPSRSRVIS